MDQSPQDKTQTPTELSPEMGGHWEVDTGNSVHVWDLDVMTYTRLPGPTAGPLAYDRLEMPITRVEIWPSVGRRFFLWFDDPVDPLMEQWRASSTVATITPAAVTATDTPETPEA